MTGRITVDGVKKNVEVNDLHLRSDIFLRISSSSNIDDRTSAFVKSAAGSPIENTCSRCRQPGFLSTVVAARPRLRSLLIIFVSERFSFRARFLISIINSSSILMVVRMKTS